MCAELLFIVSRGDDVLVNEIVHPGDTMIVGEGYTVTISNLSSKSALVGYDIISSWE